MGYYTRFYGRLEFTRELTEPELAWIDEIIHADHAPVTPEITETLSREREARRLPGCAMMYHGPDEASRRMELLGFVAPMGPPGYIDYEITEDGKGLEHAKTEKSYTMVEGLNFIIANARCRIPDFGLTGRMFADTEFEPYHWVIRIGDDGWAEEVPCAYEDVERARLAHVFAQPRPRLEQTLRQDAGAITIVNRDSELAVAQVCWLVQERQAGIALELGGGMVCDDGRMHVTLRLGEAKALAKWLSKRVRAERLWRALPGRARGAWVNVKARREMQRNFWC